MRTCISLAVAAAVLMGMPTPQCRAQESATAKMSAREIFYSALKKPAKTTTTPSRPVRVEVEKPDVPEPPVLHSATVNKPEKPPLTPIKEKEEPVVSPTQPPVTPAEEQPQFIPAMATTESTTPLGLRYSVLKRVGPSDLVEVDSSIVFRAGDRIRLRVEVNDTGYLYIVHRGSSGVWKPLFPSPEVDGGNNLVEAGRTYDIPKGYVFTFDEQEGEEQLFLVLSRQPAENLEKLIYKLSQPGAVKAGEPAEKEKPAKLLMAHNLIDIDDGVVNLMRTAYARDLIIEKVDDTMPGPSERKEKAVYVVAPAGASDSHVVADLKLIHR